MKFREIFRFEFACQLRRVWPWLIFAVMIGLNFLMTRDGSLSEVLYADFFLNSPFSIAKTTVFGCLIWLVMSAAVAGDAAARDVASGIYPLIYTAPISRAEYLGGRFLAAFTVNALLLLSVPAGTLLGVYLPGVDAELIGPFRLASYLTAYAYIALPNAFAATAIQFLVASRSGRPMASYFGSFLIIFMGFFVASLLLFKRGLGTLLDPIGIRFIIEDVAHLWTTAEKNWRLLEPEGLVLYNRLLWLGIGVLTLMITYAGFRFSDRSIRIPFAKLRLGWLRLKASPKQQDMGMHGRPDSIPATPAVSFGRQSFRRIDALRQVLATATISFKAIAASVPGLALLIVIPLLSVPVVLDQMSSEGVALVPKTVLVIRELTGSLSDELSRWVIIPFLIVFFAGELIWRERDARLAEITDTMPGSDWIPFIGKFLGLAFVIMVFLIVLMTCGMLSQAILGYYDFQVGLYLKSMLGLQLVEYLLFALLALVVHVAANHKYVGHLVALMIYVIIAMASLFGIEHNLLIYSAGPGWTYTEMRGFGNSLLPWAWFKLYWTAWAVLLALAARLLWVRGQVTALRTRLNLARKRITGSVTITAAFAILSIAALGGFIFYNTNVLNNYNSTAELKQRGARYEKLYGNYADSPQPVAKAVRLHIEIYPDRGEAAVRGIYRLFNHTTSAIDSIHVAIEPAVETRFLKFDRPADLVVNDRDLSHRIYKLERPLRPGDTIQMEFLVHRAAKGFRESGADDDIVANGTSFNNSWLPRIGYQHSRQLISAADRRKHGLPARPLIASLYDDEARNKRVNGGATFDAVIGTSAGQVAVAPGALRRVWSASSGRRYFHYSSERPVGSEWTFFSADYRIQNETWRRSARSGEAPVTIRIFYHPAHPANVERMSKSIRASLDYYTKTFGPYHYRHINFVERPGNGTGMHADPGLITFTEGTSYWGQNENSASVDLPFAVVAHEMAHQWTVPYAAVEGAPVMSESLAWYYAMKVVEKSRGPQQLEHLLNFMRQPHPIAPIRRGEPLLQGLDKYLAYRRGPFALYTLNSYLGEKPVNTALRRLLEKHRQPGSPLATTLDLYRELETVTPDSLQYLLHDLFKVNTYWDLKTEQVAAKRQPNGGWLVTLDVTAQKSFFDIEGEETKTPMNEWVEIGVFGPDRKQENVALYLKKHRVRSGRQRIVLNLPEKPSHAGIDPHHLLIDLNSEDNMRAVQINENKPESK